MTDSPALSLPVVSNSWLGDGAAHHSDPPEMSTSILGRLRSEDWSPPSLVVSWTL